MEVGPWWGKADPKTSESLPEQQSGHDATIMMFLLIYWSEKTKITTTI